MKNVLLPTDLSVQSLWPIHNIVKEAKEEKVNIQLIHMLDLPSSLMDLFLIKESKPYQSVPANFTEAYQVLCHKYKNTIQRISFRFLYGNTCWILNNFLEANKIDAVYVLTNYTYKKPLPQSIDCISLLKKCKTQLRSLPLNSEAHSEYQILSALLNGDEQYEASTVSPFRRSAIDQF